MRPTTRPSPGADRPPARRAGTLPARRRDRLPAATASDPSRLERRALDRDRGEPLAAGERDLPPPRPTPRNARPLAEWPTRPRILVTNDDGIESRGLLALKQALEPVGDVYVVAPETNQSAVGHTKTFMRPLRVRERTLADGIGGLVGRRLAHRRGEPRLPGLLRRRLRPGRLGHQLRRQPGRRRDLFGHGQRGHGGGASTSVPAFAISQEYYQHPDFSAGRPHGPPGRGQHPGARPGPRRAAQHQRAGHRRRELRGRRGDAHGQAHLPGPADRTPRPAGRALLLDRRAAAVRAGRARHRLPRGGQPTHRGHAHPARPDGEPGPLAPGRMGLAALA